MKNKLQISSTIDFYTKIPNKLFEMDLSAGAILLFTYLLSQDESFNPSLRTIEKKLGMSVKTIRKCYAELETYGIVRCYHMGYKGVTKKYEFLQIRNWKTETRNASILDPKRLPDGNPW